MTDSVARNLDGRRILRSDIASDIDLAELVREGVLFKALDHLLPWFSRCITRRQDVFRVMGSARLPGKSGWRG